ncbi:hypothetical protein N7462_006504 [Penicillium macrosclerotiorum]|uniref:uncharacterized protein n=1 Tax=Penicillium macrosclerotiorum TaxID=303699 RepID=UPI002548200C|nr:uncharacterized protein N7462_006504 [Penicillium macrosclerotiorum]KAJ5683339.1 hypothetical protein N7462_006504 [Penicillium macrosclerotiorum]
MPESGKPALGELAAPAASGFFGTNFQKPAFKPLLFVPAGQQNEIMAKVIWWVDAACHERLPKGGNHWCLYLRVGENLSVCIDITPSYTVPSTLIPGGSKANMIVSLLDYAISPSAQKIVKFDVMHGTKVGEFIDLFIQHGRHKYEFNSEGQGCRYWTDDQINLLHQYGLLVNQTQIQAAKAAILTQWPDEKYYPLVQGGYQ